MNHAGPLKLQRLTELASGAGVREILRIDPRRSNITETRINLLIPAIDQRHIYGGISTALKFFKELASGCGRARIVLTGTVVPNRKYLGFFSDYKLARAEDDLDAPKQIVSVAESPGRSLPIGPGDLFVATVWYTAYAIRRLVVWQNNEFNQVAKPMIYFIQDYEPGFYSWSSQYLLALDTYDYTGPIVAVFNTDLLRQYIRMQNRSFTYEYCFEPQMNEVLRRKLSTIRNVKKRRLLLVYGRPSTPRNAFALVVEALRIWANEFSKVSNWKVLSVGERHRSIPLGSNMVMRSAGKLSLEQYARVLGESAVGLSLHVSPHPSYPPLEMAHFGMWVITNNFANKDISSWHDNIVSVTDYSPENIASELIRLCERFEADPAAGYYGQSNVPNYLSDESPFPFIDKIWEHLNS